MEYKLKILSPVHIGCGEEYNGLNFFIDENYVYVVEPYSIIKFLGGENAKDFSEWLEKNTNEIEQLNNRIKSLKRIDTNSGEIDVIRRELNKIRQTFNLKNFIKLKKISLEKMKEYCLYSINFNNGFSEEKEFYPFIKQMNRPYVPGTEIKGAIRTAILYCAFMDDLDIQSWFKDAIEEFKNEYIERGAKKYIDLINDVKKNMRSPDKKIKNRLVEKIKEIEDKLQNKILNMNKKNPDAKYDVFKFLQVGDTELFNIDLLLIAYSEPFNISKKFKAFYEFIKPGVELKITSFKLEDNISKDIKLKKLSNYEKLKDTIKELPAILEKCYRFSNDLLDYEIDYFNHHRQNVIVKHLKEIKEQNSPDSPVLRIGKDEGYSSLTIGLAIKKTLPDIYEKILIHTTKNKSYDSSITRDDYYYPKSRKIVDWENSNLTAGWVKIISEQDKESKPIVSGDQEASKIEKTTNLDPSAILALQKKFGGKR